MELDTVESSLFEGLKDKVFTVTTDDGETAEMTLIENKSHKKTYPEAKRDPFSLLFKTEEHLGQGIFDFSCEGFEGMKVFMTPVQGPDTTSDYCEVVFN